MLQQIKKAYYLFLYIPYGIRERTIYTYPADRDTEIIKNPATGIVFFLHVIILGSLYILLLSIIESLTLHTLPSILEYILILVFLCGGLFIPYKALSGNEETWDKYAGRFKKYSNLKIGIASAFFISCIILLLFLTIKVGGYSRELHQSGLITPY